MALLLSSLQSVVPFSIFREPFNLLSLALLLSSLQSVVPFSIFREPVTYALLLSSGPGHLEGTIAC